MIGEENVRYYKRRATRHEIGGGQLNDEQYKQKEQLRLRVNSSFLPARLKSGHYLGVRGRVVRDGKGREAHRGREVKTSSGATPERDLVGYF